MVTIYTENGQVADDCTVNDECKRTRTMRLGAVSLGTALLLSLIGAYNLSKDVKDLTNHKLAYIQQDVSILQMDANEGKLTTRM
jgi:hypothetical protein